MIKNYKIILENLPDAVLIAPLGYGQTFGKFIDFNKTASILLELEDYEILSKNPLEIFFHNSENKAVEVIKELVSKEYAIFQTEIKSKSNNIIPLEVSSRLIYEAGLSLVIFVARSLIVRKKLENDLKVMSEKLRRLALRLQTIREEERKTIARELHDELGQNLTVLKIQLSLLQKNSEENKIKEKLNNLISICETTIKTVQEITSKLRPDILDELGLIPAIEWQLKKFSQATNIEYEFEINSNCTKLNPDHSIALFRILQEALTNVARHSNASKVKVSIEENDNECILKILDNGKGITLHQIESPNSIGILGMKERATVLGGEFMIKSTMNSGTLVCVKIPIK